MAKTTPQQRRKNYAILFALMAFIVLIFFVTISRLKSGVAERLELEAAAAKQEAVLQENAADYLENLQ